MALEDELRALEDGRRTMETRMRTLQQFADFQQAIRSQQQAQTSEQPARRKRTSDNVLHAQMHIVASPPAAAAALAGSSAACIARACTSDDGVNAASPFVLHVSVTNRSATRQSMPLLPSMQLVVRIRLVPLANGEESTTAVNPIALDFAAAPFSSSQQLQWTVGSSVHLPIPLDSHLLEDARMHVQAALRIELDSAVTTTGTERPNEVLEFLLAEWLLDLWDVTTGFVPGTTTGATRDHQRTSSKRKREPTAANGTEEKPAAEPSRASTPVAASVFAAPTGAPTGALAHEARTCALLPKPTLFGSLCSHARWYARCLAYPTAASVPRGLSPASLSDGDNNSRSFEVAFALPLLLGKKPLASASAGYFARLLLQFLMPAHTLSAASPLPSLLPPSAVGTAASSPAHSARTQLTTLVHGHPLVWTIETGAVAGSSTACVFTVQAPPDSRLSSRTLRRIRACLLERLRMILFGAGDSSAAASMPSIQLRRMGALASDVPAHEREAYECMQAYLSAGRAAAAAVSNPAASKFALTPQQQAANAALVSHFERLHATLVARFKQHHDDLQL